MRGEALFRLAHWARAEGDLDLALGTLDAHLAAIPREDDFRTAGRTLYWRGRVLDAMGRRPEAIESWTRAIREYPLSFYAVVALDRLEGADPGAIRLLRRDLPTDGGATGWRFPLDDALRSEPFGRAVDLLRLGLREEALAEIDWLGWDGEDAPVERRWLVAVLLARAGDLRRSHDVVRKAIDGWQRAWPIGPDRKRWELAFPRPFDEVVADATTSERLPPDLIFAIMREESAFDAGVESRANAVGLMQLIAPTARRFAAPLSLPSDARSLRRPEVNVRIGAAYVRFLLDEFAGALPLAVAGYNAGEAAVARWLDACPSGRTAAQSLDEWVEAIPYDETRGYTKRVLATYATYRFLAGGWDAVPRLAAAVEHPACATAATASR
jgi:soluble lytic murein transglycosylase